MMKRLKLVALSAFSFLAIIAIVFSSCEKQDVNYGPTTFYKPCEDVICLNGGTCHDGDCNCPVGFEGTKCGIRSIDKFIGNYSAFDECFMNAQESYVAEIQSDFTPITELTLKGFSPTFCPNDLTAYITTSSTNFNIPFQQTCGNYYVSGEGNINGDVLNVNLSFRDSLNHTTSNCDILLNKQ
jgi:hypothetical protein